MLSPSETDIVHNCLLDFRDSSSLKLDGFLPLLLSRLLDFEGVGLEMSGVYLSNDQDIDNIPDYLLDTCGMAFEFMGEYVVVPFLDGAIIISDWCDKNVAHDREVIANICSDLIKKYRSMAFE
jgi:hypothetical protein